MNIDSPSSLPSSNIQHFFDRRSFEAELPEDKHVANSNHDAQTYKDSPNTTRAPQTTGTRRPSHDPPEGKRQTERTLEPAGPQQKRSRSGILSDRSLHRVNIWGDDTRRLSSTAPQPARWPLPQTKDGTRRPTLRRCARYTTDSPRAGFFCVAGRGSLCEHNFRGSFTE